jgi:hypothetical protein
MQGMPNSNYPYPHYPPPMPYYQPQPFFVQAGPNGAPGMPPAYYGHSNQQMTHAPAPINQPPVKPTKKITYPHIDHWLLYVDGKPDRWEDGVSFAQYAAKFADLGFLRLNQLANNPRVSLENIREWTGLPIGHADLLLGYAAEDIRRIDSGELDATLTDPDDINCNI